MCCGGEMTVFIEPVVKRSSLICFGAGHIAQALCPLAVKLGFLVSVVDERKDLLDHEAFAQLEHRFSDPSLFSCSDMPFGDATFVVVATHAHDLDQQIVENVLKQRYRFLALVGSERKAAMTKKRLRAKNFAENDIARVVCPAGLAINASTPEEIALSIVAQMIQVKNNASSWRLDCSGG
jgi:xanthine dehydrogenase accessory factor